MIKTTKLKCRSVDTVTVHVNPELVFRRALVLANCREDVTVEKDGCQLKARDLIFFKIKFHLTKGSKPFCIY
jgi:hypothetical protein